MSCFHPITIKSPYNKNAFIEAPCGKCAGCRENLRNQWFIRFIDESKNKICRFITLTYDDENIPYSIDDDGCIHYNVDKEQLVKFFKRMRKNNKFKYFAVSEYGSLTQRPHYHLLLFSNKNIDIEKYWKYGFVVNLPAGLGSFKYVTKYLLKGSNCPEGSNKNFMICSKRPAIGLSYVNELAIDKLDDPIVRINDTIYPLPRYYRKKLYSKMDNDGENKKKLIIEELESKLKNSDLYRKFLENHGPDENFYQWLRFCENQKNKKQVEIKKSLKDG